MILIRATGTCSFSPAMLIRGCFIRYFVLGERRAQLQFAFSARRAKDDGVIKLQQSTNGHIGGSDENKFVRYDEPNDDLLAQLVANCSLTGERESTIGSECPAPFDLYLRS